MDNKQPKVLVIDDDPRILELLRTILKSKGLEVITCESPLEGLDVIQTHDDIKLILLDVVMPEMNGIDTLKKVMEVSPSAHVIMITGNEDVEIALECMKLGAKDFIQKPFDLEYLETSVFADIIAQLW